MADEDAILSDIQELQDERLKRILVALVEWCHELEFEALEAQEGVAKLKKAAKDDNANR